MRNAACAGILGAAMAAGLPAQAHHSLSGYEHGRHHSIEAVVVEFRFINPHAFLILESAGETWRIEMDDRNELLDAGVTGTTFRPRDRVSVTGRPGRGDPRAMYLARVERAADGLVLEQIGSSPRLTQGPR
jgi:hypothetical protein